MFAVEKSPTSHPARVNGTHGAGVTLFAGPVAGTVAEYDMDGAVSTGFGWAGVFLVSMIGDVQ
jgi:hypothetical protein